MTEVCHPIKFLHALTTMYELVGSIFYCLLHVYKDPRQEKHATCRKPIVSMLDSDAVGNHGSGELENITHQLNDLTGCRSRRRSGAGVGAGVGLEWGRSSRRSGPKWGHSANGGVRRLGGVRAGCARGWGWWWSRPQVFIPARIQHLKCRILFKATELY